MTEKKAIYTVGQDIDNSSTTRTHAVDLQAQNLAQVWRDFKYPLPYERVFVIGGTRVKVLVEDNTEAAALKRLEDLMSDRSIDA